MKHCPYCAEEIQDGAIVCRFCNRQVGGSLQAPIAGSATDIGLSTHGPLNADSRATSVAGYIMGVVGGVLGFAAAFLTYYNSEAGFDFHATFWEANFDYSKFVWLGVCVLVPGVITAGAIFGLAGRKFTWAGSALAGASLIWFLQTLPPLDADFNTLGIGGWVLPGAALLAFTGGVVAMVDAKH